MTKEREYYFTVKKRGKEHRITVKESDLTPKHKDMLLGQAIDDFNGFPQDVQVRFMSMLIDAAKEAYDPENTTMKMFDVNGKVVEVSQTDMIKATDDENMKAYATRDSQKIYPVPLTTDILNKAE